LARAGRQREACEAMLDAALWCWRRAERDARQRRAQLLCSWADAGGYVDLSARGLAELGHLNAELGQFDQALAAVDSARTALASGLSEAAGAWVCLRRAQTLTLNGRAQEGVEICEEAIALAKIADESEVETIGLIQVALDRYRRNQLDEARAMFDLARAVARKSKNRATEAQALLQCSSLEPVPAREQLLRSAIDMARAAGALRIELMARQLWVDALWKLGEHERARQQAAWVSAEAARRSLRQTVSIVELQAACWAVEQQDWARASEHRAVAIRWGALTGAVPERAFAWALELVLAITSNEQERAARAVQRLQCEAPGYGDHTFRDLIACAESAASAQLAGSIAELRR
jgi:hypothetical protein